MAKSRRWKVRQVEGFRPVAYDIPKGCAGAYFPRLMLLWEWSNGEAQLYTHVQVHSDWYKL